jgi:hypothetical protein
MRSFNDFLKKDRAKAAVTRISELGLVEMTRKRTRESLLHHLTEPCHHCEGKGYTKSRRTIAYELLRELRRQGNLIQGDTILVEVHPEVAQVLATSDRQYLDEMEKRLFKRIVVKARGSFHMEDFEIRSPSDKQPLEKSEAASRGDNDPRENRRKKRRRRLGPPAEIEALLEEEEESSVVDPEALASRGGPPVRNGDSAVGAESSYAHRVTPQTMPAVPDGAVRGAGARGETETENAPSPTEPPKAPEG